MYLGGGLSGSRPRPFKSVRATGWTRIARATGRATAAVGSNEAASPAQATAQEGDIPFLSQPLHGISHGAPSCAVIFSGRAGASENAGVGPATSVTQRSTLTNRVAILRRSRIAISLGYTGQVAPTLTRKTVKSPGNVIDLWVNLSRTAYDDGRAGDCPQAKAPCSCGSTDQNTAARHTAGYAPTHAMPWWSTFASSVQGRPPVAFATWVS